MGVLLYNRELRETDPANREDLVYEAIEFDAVVSVTHSGASEITRHPVEKGQDLSDHSIPRPREITLDQAIVSNFPLAFPGQQQLSNLANGGLSASQLSNIGSSSLKSFAQGIVDVEPLGERAYERLEKWRKAGTALVLVDDLATYQNVLIESITVARDARTSCGLFASIKLVDIVVAATRLVGIPNTQRAAPRSNQGPKAKAAATDGEKSNGSALFGLFGDSTKSYMGPSIGAP